MAQAFQEMGFRLALCARGTSPLPEDEAVLHHRLDVRDAEAVQRFAAAASDRFGAIDLWINNAGILDPIAPLRDVSAEDAQRHMEINVLGVVHGSQAFVRHVRQREGDGVLVNISSGAARKAYSGWSLYCAAKAAVDRLTECIALEEQEHGLRAISLAPGVVDTGMQAKIRASSEADFPDLPRFLDMKRNERFNTSKFVAEQILRLAFEPAPDAPVLERIPNEWEL